jgi:hypothetical protein
MTDINAFSRTGDGDAIRRFRHAVKDSERKRIDAYPSLDYEHRRESLCEML